MSSFEFVSIKNLDSSSIFSTIMKATVLDSALFAFHQSSGAATSSAGIEDVNVIISAWLSETSQSAGRNATVCSAVCTSANSVFGSWAYMGLASNSRNAQQVSQL